MISERCDNIPSQISTKNNKCIFTTFHQLIQHPQFPMQASMHAVCIQRLICNPEASTLNEAKVLGKLHVQFLHSNEQIKIKEYRNLYKYIVS